MIVELLTDAGAFVAAAIDVLDADPVPNNVVASQAQRVCDERAAGNTPAAGEPVDLWFVVRDQSGAVISAAMRTPGLPAYLLAMPASAAEQVAQALYPRVPDLTGVNGDTEAAWTFAQAWSRLTGVAVVQRRASRLFRLDRLTAPASVPGRLRAATTADLDLLYSWTLAFAREAGGGEAPARAQVARKVELGHAWLWLVDREDGSGEQPVSYTGCSVPVRGVHRVGPVYTPPARRGHGYASACVARVSALLRGGTGPDGPAGEQVCLFTDLANPTSNKIYRAIGYEPVRDTVNLGFEPAT